MAEKHIISSILSFHRSNKSALEYIKDGFLALAEIGFRGIDFNTDILTRVSENREQIILEIAKSAKENGLTFCQCHLPFISQKDGVPDGDIFNKKVFAALDCAKALGIKYAVMHPNTTSIPLETYDKKEQYDRVMTFFAPFVEYSNKVGVEMIIENMRSVQGASPSHRYCASPDELCDIADACGIGVCWDTGHANITGLCQSEAIEFVGNRLKAVHLNDNVGGEDVHYSPYMGTVDWADVMKGLKTIGYQGAINFELAGGKIPKNALSDFGRYVRKTGEYFKTLL